MLLLSGRAATAAYRRFTRSATCSTRCSDACWHFRRLFARGLQAARARGGQRAAVAVLVYRSAHRTRDAAAGALGLRCDAGGVCAAARFPTGSTSSSPPSPSPVPSLPPQRARAATPWRRRAARAAAFAGEAQPRASLRSTEQRLVTDAYRYPRPSVARGTPPGPTDQKVGARCSKARTTHPVDLGHRVPLQPPRHALRARANERTPRAGSAHLFVGAERLRALDETAAARVRVLRAEPVRDARRRIEARTAVSGACAPAAAKHSKNAFACFAQPLGASGK